MEDSVVNIQADVERWRVFSGRLVDVRPKEDGRVFWRFKASPTTRFSQGGFNTLEIRD